MQSTPPAVPLSVSPTSVAAAFAALPDPRRAASVIYPLPALLALGVAAILANHLSVLAIAEWGARQHAAMRAALGFPTERTPCQSTLQRLVCQRDGHALAATLTACFAPSATLAATDPGPQGIAIDGKAQRGRFRFPGGGGPVHALSAFGHDHGVVLAHEPMAAAAGAAKGEAELSVAPALLERMAWPGRVLTGDALFCQRTLCQQLRDRGGADGLLVKENQPTLYQDIQLRFDPPTDLATLPLLDRREVGTRERGVTKRAVRSGITSVSPADGPPARLLALRRGHWGIENQLHRRKDVTCSEDPSLVHVGQGPTVMALLRDAAVSLLHQAGVQRIAPRLRAHSQHPADAVALVIGPLLTRAQALRDNGDRLAILAVSAILPPERVFVMRTGLSIVEWLELRERAGQFRGSDSTERRGDGPARSDGGTRSLGDDTAPGTVQHPDRRATRPSVRHWTPDTARDTRPHDLCH